MKTEVVLYRHSVVFAVTENEYVTIKDGTGDLTQNELLNLALQVARREYELFDFNITVLEK